MLITVNRYARYRREIVTNKCAAMPCRTRDLKVGDCRVSGWHNKHTFTVEAHITSIIRQARVVLITWTDSPMNDDGTRRPDCYAPDCMIMVWRPGE